jgi:hypothetical protein
MIRKKQNKQRGERAAQRGQFTTIHGGFIRSVWNVPLYLEGTALPRDLASDEGRILV